MKLRILLITAAAAVAASYAQAIPPGQRVPDSANVAGMLTLGLLVAVAARRKFSK